MSKLKRMLKSPRIILLLAMLMLSIVAINPFGTGEEGVAIRSISNGSSAALAQPAFKVDPNLPPRNRELILQINNEKINTITDYARITSELRPFQNITVTTNKHSHVYRLTVLPMYNVTITNETEFRIVQEFDPELNQTVNVSKEFPIVKREIIGIHNLGFNVYPAPTSNIRMGLDLAGGTRVLLQPEEEISPEILELTIDNIKERLNVFGLSDLTVRPVSDLSGQHYISIEIAGINQDDIINLLASQGKFEAKIGNNSVFMGGENDIPYVCFSAACSGIDMITPCAKTSEGSYVCTFRFSITISKEAAQRQADATRDLAVITENGYSYLSESLDLYLDGELVDSLRVGSVFKGNALTDIQISGPGTGLTEQAAMQNALDSMKRLQTILKTGSLPVKLNIIKTDTISPVLGRQFTQNAILVGLLSIIIVGVVLFLRYRDWKVSVPIVFTMLFETVIIFGVAALIRWNLDLAAIAGIIIALGTGVDSQIVIADEILRGEGKYSVNWKEKLKSAFFIIMGAYLTTVVAMLPLFSAGAGLLRGFALTTIIGVSIGVFVTRPAYAKIVQVLKE